MYMRIHIYIYTYIHTYTYNYMYMYMYTYICTHTFPLEHATGNPMDVFIKIHWASDNPLEHTTDK